MTSVALAVQAPQTVWTDGQTLRIFPPGGSLASFIQKSKSAPNIWDHGQDGAGPINANWSHGTPFSAPAGYNLANVAAPFQKDGSSTVNGPHQFCKVFQAGCHYSNTDSNAGYDVGSSFTFTFGSLVNLPAYCVMSAYLLRDPNWYYAQYPYQVIFSGTLTNGSAVITNINTSPAPFKFITQPGTQFYNIPGLNDFFHVSDNGVDQITMSSPFTGTTGTYSAIYTINAHYDNNEKPFNFCQGSGAYNGSPGGQYSWYDNFRNNTNGGYSNCTFAYPIDNTGFCPHTLLDDSSACLKFPDANNHSATWNHGLNPSAGWRKVDLVMRFDPTINGYYVTLENNTYVASLGAGSILNPGPLVNYYGYTVWGRGSAQSTQVTIGFTTYARNEGPMPSTPDYGGLGTPGTYTQWRYQACQYLDIEQSNLARMYISNDPNLSIGNGSVCEIQPYFNTTTGYWDITINRGQVNAGQAYVYYVDEANGVPMTQCRSLILG